MNHVHCATLASTGERYDIFHFEKMLHQIISGARCFLVKFINNDLTVWKIQQIILRIRAKNSHEARMGKIKIWKSRLERAFLEKKKNTIHFTFLRLRHIEVVAIFSLLMIIIKTIISQKLIKTDCNPGFKSGLSFCK